MCEEKTCCGKEGSDQSICLCKKIGQQVPESVISEIYGPKALNPIEWLTKIWSIVPESVVTRIKQAPNEREARRIAIAFHNEKIIRAEENNFCLTV